MTMKALRIGSDEIFMSTLFLKLFTFEPFVYCQQFKLCIGCKDSSLQDIDSDIAIYQGGIYTTGRYRRRLR
jgi:hypothetical protein